MCTASEQIARNLNEGHLLFLLEVLTVEELFTVKDLYTFEDLFTVEDLYTVEDLCTVKDLYDVMSLSSMLKGGLCKRGGWGRHGWRSSVPARRSFSSALLSFPMLLLTEHDVAKVARGEEWREASRSCLMLILHPVCCAWCCSCWRAQRAQLRQKLREMQGDTAREIFMRRRQQMDVGVVRARLVCALVLTLEGSLIVTHTCSLVSPGP